MREEPTLVCVTSEDAREHSCHTDCSPVDCSPNDTDCSPADYSPNGLACHTDCSPIDLD